MDSQGRESKIVEPYYLRLYDAADAELKSVGSLKRWPTIAGTALIQSLLDRGRQLEEVWTNYGNDIDLLIHTIEREKTND